jgi:RNA polymerase sigma-70 factor, ECF subfamily
MTDSVSDEDLMLRYGAGDARAFETLYGRHKGALYRYFLRLVRPAAVAEELFQDVWMNVVRARAQYEVRAKFTTWLYRLAHNRLIDHYRRSSSSLPMSYTEENDVIVDSAVDEAVREPENELDRRRLGRRLIEAITELPEAQRETFLLREESGFSLEEIAAATGVSFETAKSRLRYALARLRRALASEMSPRRPRAQGRR